METILPSLKNVPFSASGIVGTLSCRNKHNSYVTKNNYLKRLMQKMQCQKIFIISCILPIFCTKECSTQYRGSKKCSTQYRACKKCSTQYRGSKKCSTQYRASKKCSTQYRASKKCSTQYPGS